MDGSTTLLFYFHTLSVPGLGIPIESFVHNTKFLVQYGN